MTFSSLPWLLWCSPAFCWLSLPHCLLLLCLLSTEPQVPFCRAALQPDRSQPLLCSWIMFSHVQDLIFVELHKVLVSPLFRFIQVFLQGGCPFWSVNFPTCFGVFIRLCCATLGPIVQVTYEELNSIGPNIDSWRPHLWQVSSFRRSCLLPPSECSL